MSDTDIQITSAEIAETIVRTAYSRIEDCLLVLKDQNYDVGVIQLSKSSQDRMTNMLVQDFIHAHKPCHGSTPLRHTNATDKLRDLAVASEFNGLNGNTQLAIAQSAFRQLVGNMNASKIMGGVKFQF